MIAELLKWQVFFLAYQSNGFAPLVSPNFDGNHRCTTNKINCVSDVINTDIFILTGFCEGTLIYYQAFDVRYHEKWRLAFLLQVFNTIRERSMQLGTNSGSTFYFYKTLCRTIELKDAGRFMSLAPSFKWNIAVSFHRLRMKVTNVILKYRLRFVFTFDISFASCELWL